MTREVTRRWKCLSYCVEIGDVDIRPADWMVDVMKYFFKRNEFDDGGEKCLEYCVEIGDVDIRPAD